MNPRNLFLTGALAAGMLALPAHAARPSPFEKPSAAPPPAVADPAVSGQGGSGPGAPSAAVPKGPVVLEELVPASRVGRVNGRYIYRGTDGSTYVFEKVGEPRIVRRATTPEMAQAEAATHADGTRPNLPSIVGSASPGLAPSIPVPSAGQPTPASASAPRRGHEAAPRPGPTSPTHQLTYGQ